MYYLGLGYFIFFNVYMLLFMYLEFQRKPRISKKLKKYAWIFIIILTGIIPSIAAKTLVAGFACTLILGFMCCMSYDGDGEGGELPF